MSAPAQRAPDAPSLLASPWLWGLVGWVLALMLAHHAVLLSGLRLIQGDEGDVRFVHYVLEHGFLYLRGDVAHARFWDAPFFHPATNTIAYSDPLLGVLPLYAAWRAVGLPPDTAYPFWVFSITSLNYLAALWLLRKGFGVSSGAAMVGAVLFAAGASRINQTNHPQLLAQFYSVLAVGALLALARPETSRRAGAGWAALLVASCVAQLYAGFYWGWFLGFFLVLTGLVALGFRDTRTRLFQGLRTHGPALVGWGVLGAVALLPLVQHSLAAAREVGLRSFAEASGMVPRFATWFHMGDANWLYGWTGAFRTFTRIPVEGEHRVGLGVLTLVLAGAGLWQARARPAARLLMGVVLVTVLIATHYRGGMTPWWWVFHGFPGARAVRAVCRMGIWMLLPASVGLALFLSRQARAGHAWVAALLGSVCLLEQGVSVGTFDAAASRADIRGVAGQVGPGCQGFFYNPVGGTEPTWKYQIDAMWAALERGVPTLNGYSGNAPPGWALDPVGGASARRAARLDEAVDAWARARGLDASGICRVTRPGPATSPPPP
ncbi:hypothetical protein [Melittangium boletus]|uniref:Glycosyltransferase RgtA/B/C/D-like domain-containing protein n=1 Tax=Melittangium boletus DSM 14713 TaxID=1294270 RepID=A0A250ID89_9BACT|nr:hypothetical protein [Melittangium boletus]ATB29809.1 hypothetical protein MEBOL_003264 [Melittangium boletus DSM 14713]